MFSTIMPLTLTYSAVCIVFLVFTVTHSTNPAFVVVPSSQVVGIGQEAVFRCHDPTTTAIGWRWNGSEVMVGNPPPGITPGSGSLAIVAQLNYNETEIVCLALSSSGSVETTPVRLLIQGPLRKVMKIKRTSSDFTVTWEAPFSLDLTGVDPDIVYCVEVYNITCGVDDLVVGDCNVTEVQYVNEQLQQGYIYRFTITPRSNGQDAQNGTSNTKEEFFITALTDPRTSIMFVNGSMRVTAVIVFRHEGTGVTPASYFLNLTSIDGTEELSNTIILFTQDTNANSTTLTVSQPLPYQRLWNCQILALGCSEHPITNIFEISSHDFQNITVNSSRPGGISVTGDFIPGSSSIGILVVVYSAADDEYNKTMIKYHFVHRSDIRMTITMTNLRGGRIEVSVFVVEENGLPFNRSATTPINISLIEGDDIQSIFEYQLHPTSTSTCVNCTFLDNNSTACVAVVHQRISQLSSSGLMNIESSLKFNRSGDTAYGCIEGVNLTDHQIGVFNLVEVVPTLPTSPHGVLDVGIIVTIVVVLFIAILLLATIILIIVCCKKRLLSLIQSIREYIPKKSRIGTLQQLTTGSSSSQTDDEGTYDILRDPVKNSQVAAKEEEALGTAPVYSPLGYTHPPQSVTKEGGVPSTAIYSLLDKDSSQSVNPPQSGVLYTSVNLGQPSGLMGHDDDLHKTTTPYSELQQVEEESFNKGPGNTFDVTRIDTITNGDVLSDFNDEVVYIFNLAQEYVIPSELTTLLEETDDDNRHLAITCM